MFCIAPDNPANENPYASATDGNTKLSVPTKLIKDIVPENTRRAVPMNSAIVLQTRRV